MYKENPSPREEILFRANEQNKDLDKSLFAKYPGKDGCFTLHKYFLSIPITKPYMDQCTRAISLI